MFKGVNKVLYIYIYCFIFALPNKNKRQTGHLLLSGYKPSQNLVLRVNIRRFGTVGVIKFTYPPDEAATGRNHRGKDKQEKRTYPYRLYAYEFYFIFDILVFC